MNAVTLSSPAKINHFLHINGKREDGYHNIQTLFQFIDYSDELTFHLTDHDDIKVNMKFSTGQACHIPVQENLIYKLGNFLKNAYNIGSGIEITVHKKIPLGAGLGGGSSNAATTLLALNFLWELNLPVEKLMAIGKCFGADIPFFILGQTAWGEGIGTDLTKTELSEFHAIVLNPPCLVSTIKMYQHPQLTRNTSPFKIVTLEGLLKYGNIEHALKNDFEPLVCQTYPVVAEQLAWLNQYGQAKLSGSGASIFALFEQKSEAEKVLAELPNTFKGFLAKCVNHSPLHTQLSNLGFFV